MGYSNTRRLETVRTWVFLAFFLGGCSATPRPQPWNFPKAEEWNKPLEFSWVNAVDNWRKVTDGNKKPSIFVTPEREIKPDEDAKVLDRDLDEHELYQ